MTCAHFDKHAHTLFSKTTNQHFKSFHLFHFLLDRCKHTHPHCACLEPATVNLSLCGRTRVAFPKQLEHTHVCMRASGSSVLQANHALVSCTSLMKIWMQISKNKPTLSHAFWTHSVDSVVCCLVCLRHAKNKRCFYLHQRVSVKYCFIRDHSFRKLEQKLVTYRCRR